MNKFLQLAIIALGFLIEAAIWISIYKYLGIPGLIIAIGIFSAITVYKMQKAQERLTDFLNNINKGN